MILHANQPIPERRKRAMFIANVAQQSPGSAGAASHVFRSHGAQDTPASFYKHRAPTALRAEPLLSEFACRLFSLPSPNGQTKVRPAVSSLLWQFAFQGGDELCGVGVDDGIQTQQEIETIKAAS